MRQRPQHWGSRTATDSNGNYMITVNPKTLFTFLPWPGHNALSRQIAQFYNGFDIALHVDATELKEVKVMPRSYRNDSIQNRKDYAKIFNFKKPGFQLNGPAPTEQA